MAIIKRVSVKEIIAKVYRDLQLSEEADWQSMIEWMVEALEHIGTSGQVDHPIIELEVTDYKVLLPCNFIALEQISYGGFPLTKASSTFKNLPTPSNPSVTDTDAYGAVDTSILDAGDYYIANTYTIDPRYIKTSFREGTITVAYAAFPIDEEGFPEVPDDVSYREALFNYIVMKLKYIEWLDGSMPDNKYKSLIRLWEFSCKQASAKMQMPSIDQLENMKNWSIRLIPNITEHASFFTGLGAPQRLNKK